MLENIFGISSLTDSLHTNISHERYCLSVVTGEESWRADLGDKVFAAPHGIRLTPHIRAIVVATSVGRLVLLDAASGSCIAETQLPGEVFSSPVCHRGCIYVGCRDDHLYKFIVERQ